MIRLFTPFDLDFHTVPLFSYFLFICFFLRQVSLYNIISSFRYQILSGLKMFFSSLRTRPFGKGGQNLFTSSMMFLFVLNFFSVLSFNFALTSQVRVVLFISISSWLRFLIYYVFCNLKGFISHCIPQGTPIYMAWFIFLVELVRLLIRPITLAVRLTANILAGHLLIILLSKLAFSYTLIAPIYAGLNLVEIFVSIIQSYIFATLICLYYSEAV